MKVDVFSMDSFTNTGEGAAILRHAFENNVTNITTRLAPETSHEDPDGGFLLMLLDWKQQQITRLIMTVKEVEDLVEVLKSLNGMTVLDAFSTEGMTKQ